VIPGRRVVLRPPREDDFPLFHRWQNDPEIWWYMDYERPFSLEDIRADQERTRKEGFGFVITVDGRPVGRIGLNQFRRRDRICSLYLFIGDPDCWGRGFARDAVMALLRHAFDRFDLHQVELWTLAANDRVIRVYERCGFRREASLRDRSFKDGVFVDRVVMSVTRAEFADAYSNYVAEPHRESVPD
jgi:RimJ/RimL family protein N-acetyltransferase